MAKYEFTGGYPVYYPLSGLLVKPGEVHELASAPDDNWKATDAPVAAPEPVPVVAPVTDAQDAVKAAEALLEANPELAAKLVKEAADNA